MVKCHLSLIIRSSFEADRQTAHGFNPVPFFLPASGKYLYNQQ